jgi:hypothetical protein
MIVYGGRTNYGQPIGILMLDTVFPRIPGDVGNGFTFDFPVLYKIVRGANPKRVVQDADPALLEPFIEGLKELEAEGCQAVSTSCGFLDLLEKAGRGGACSGIDLVFTASALTLQDAEARGEKSAS